MDGLSIQSVDHLSVNNSATAAQADKSEGASKVAAPILLMAPHISAMLNNVFEKSELSASRESEASASESPTAGRTASGAEDTADEEENAVVPSKALVPSDDIARFQRQMYRKDI
jgi:hypothetical protein